MKPFITILAIALALTACKSNPEDVLMDKTAVEFLGNAFNAFGLEDDVNLFMTQSLEDPSKWKIQATVPVKKLIAESIDSVSIDIIPQDDKGIRLREDLTLQAQDLNNIIPVLNASPETAKTLVLSSNKDFSKKEAADILNKTMNIAMNVNMLKSHQTEVAEEEVAIQEEEQKKKEAERPTVNSLCKKYGVYGLLNQYDNLLKNREKKKAKQVEDKLWAIEKKVMADNSLPESLRKQFRQYVEETEDKIEDKY